MLMIERLESRRLMATAPYHVELAEKMIANISDAKNDYSNGTPEVRFKGIDGATDYYNKSDCSSFVTLLLQSAYRYSDQKFVEWTGEKDPEAVDYYTAANNDRGFDGFKNVANIVPGDLFIIKYTNSSDTGHVAVIAREPTYIKTTQTEKVYSLHVIDCTGSPHNPGDSRSASQDGVGEGNMRIYTNLNGVIQRYSWNNYSNGVVANPSTHLPIFAHIPAKNIAVPSNLTATVGAIQVKLKWKDNSAIETGVVIERKSESDAGWTVLANVGKNSTSYTDKAVTPGVSYKYRVSAVFHQFRSPNSDVLTVTTPQLRVNSRFSAGVLLFRLRDLLDSYFG